MIKRIAAALLLAVLAAAAAGCRSDPESPPAAAPAAGTGDPMRITLTDSWLPTSTAAVDVVHRELVDQFRREHPGLELAEDVLDNNALKQKIKTLAAGNALPDVFMVLGSDARMLLGNGLIQPVDGVLAADPSWSGGFRPEAFDDFTFDGRRAAVPMQITATSLVFYNSAMFREAGYERFPDSWEELLQALEKLKKLGYTPISFGNRDAWVAGSCLFSTLAERYVGEAWMNDAVAGTAKYSDAPFVEALRAVRSLADKGLLNADRGTLDNVQQRELYYQGKAAVVLEGGWAVSSFAADAPPHVAAQTRLALLPAPAAAPDGQEGGGLTVSGGSGWGIAFKAGLSGERLESALELVKLLTGSEQANRAAERGDLSGSHPTDYNEGASTPLFREYLSLMRQVRLTPVFDVRLPAGVTEAMYDGIQELLRTDSELTPEALAARIQSAAEADAGG
ncbi:MULTISPECIES: extracellular solute-binding protein [unclassified Paenibacillus]|uniref:extracellular solute-binding protein n=1 Tax=unclassified Paenibacillus TaxID=185978 RepID=UPI0009546544|nr:MULTISPECIES: extracellular solute-binding protein [unclassified Paenibacillus]ASS65810.1 extracellular solute-binding protein [Paenibacillus sp. RUD330]SIQ22963.1 raffinose/stachyose/melibiose transport system substrate-binding protein [Paenibacillus sp. RU4X]SIQ44592.1 raffinose/stachyose/melibiose transport system substrate-binding protein [Paenibacillus sp. RU4T]